MQAIETRFLAPTDTKPGRMVARCEAGRIVVPWASGKNVAENHRLAACALAVKLGWTLKNYGKLYGGEALCNPYGYVWVFANRCSEVAFAPDETGCAL